MTSALPRPIDPLAACASGRYEDDAVVVIRGRRTAAGHPVPAWNTRTRHFALRREKGRLVLAHDIAPDRVDNDLAGLLAEELFTPGWVAGSDIFERLLTGVVRSCTPDPVTAWEGFYRRSLDRLEAVIADGATDQGGDGGGRAYGSLAGFAPVYAHAERLALPPPGAEPSAGPAPSLVDLGCCFGFFALRLVMRRRVSVRAVDLSASTVRLLGLVSARLLGTDAPGALECITGDAAGLALADGCADTVTALHLLEHLDAAHGARVVAEAVRLARHRVVVAVPLEDEADAAFGHVSVVTLDDLAALGAMITARNGWRWRVEDHHGGWLVFQAPP